MLPVKWKKTWEREKREKVYGILLLSRLSGSCVYAPTKKYNAEELMDAYDDFVLRRKRRDEKERKMWMWRARENARQRASSLSICLSQGTHTCTAHKLKHHLVHGIPLVPFPFPKQVEEGTPKEELSVKWRRTSLTQHKGEGKKCNFSVAKVF